MLKINNYRKKKKKTLLYNANRYWEFGLKLVEQVTDHSNITNLKRLINNEQYF